MPKKSDKKILVGLDIGTSKVVAMIGELGAANHHEEDSHKIDVIGVGSGPSHGLKKGVVVNIESTVQSIQRAVEEAEQMADCQVHSVFTSISGSHIGSRNSHGTAPIKDSEVGHEDVERVIESARAVPISADQKVLHVLPQEFLIDNQEGIQEPIGMSGVRLEAKVHIVTSAVSAVQNVSKCVQRCGLEVDDVILQPLASAGAVLTEDEKELGVCLIDIGGGTTDMVIFTSGAIHYSSVIPIAGDQVTNDIAVALRTPSQHAEAIKVNDACLVQPTSAETMIDVPSMGERKPRQLSRQNLADVVRPRYQEIFEFVQSKLQRSGFESLIDAGIVVTGGGAKIDGVVDLAEEIFHLPVRLGVPRGDYFSSKASDGSAIRAINDPAYATAVGLLLVGNSQQTTRYSGTSRLDRGWITRLKRWF